MYNVPMPCANNASALTFGVLVFNNFKRNGDNTQNVTIWLGCDHTALESEGAKGLWATSVALLQVVCN